MCCYRTVAFYEATSASATEQLLRAKMANKIVLSKGALTTDRLEDSAAVGRLKGLGLNLATLPQDILYQLQDGAMVDLHAQRTTN